MMEDIKLNSGALMPRVVLGTWQATETSSDKVQEAIKYAIDCGYRHFDCAYAYMTEPDVGKGIQAKIKDGTVKREDLFITGKLWNTLHAPEDVRESLMMSLKDLQLDYLDMYLIHHPHPYKKGNGFIPVVNGVIQYDDIPNIVTWRALEKCVDEGLVKSIGISNFNTKQVQNILDNCRIKPAINQIEVHPYFSQYKVVTYCQERGVAVSAFSPLGSSERPWAVAEPASNLPPVVKNEVLAEVGKKYGKSAAQIAIKWILQRNMAVIAKSTNHNRIKENFDVNDFTLSSDDMAAVNSLNQNLRLFSYLGFEFMSGAKESLPPEEYRGYIDEF